MIARQLLLPAAILLSGIGFAQITLDNSITASFGVQNVLLGQGVSASNITFNGQPGTILNEQIGGFNGANCNIGINEGLILATGSINNAMGPNNSGSSSLGGGNTGFGDPDLAVLSDPQSVNDAAILEFDFIPTGDSLKFDFVFASDEYLEFVNGVNDIFGFFVSGPGIAGPYTNGAINIALIPGTTDPVTINTVNDVVNPGFYNVNGDGSNAPFNGSSTYVQYDGFTTVITARCMVTCGLTYHIKIALGDASDTVWDSAVFLKAGSFTSTGQIVPTLTTGVSVNDSTMFEGCGIVPFDFHRLGDTTNVDTITLTISGTATPGVDYSPGLPSQLIYQPGDTLITIPLWVPLDADGLETIQITITQNIICSGQQVQNDYLFYIDQFPALDIVTNDIASACGQQQVLAPIVTGGTGLYHFLWNTGETTPTINVGPGVTTTYYFTVSDTCSVLPWSDSILVTLPVYPPLQMTVSPTDLIDCLGNDDIAVTSASGGNDVFAYSWTQGGGNVGNTASINVPAADPSIYYVATITDGCGSSLSDSVLVGTAPLPPIVITTSDRTVICLGDTTTLTVDNVTGGNGIYTYQWTDSQHQVLSTADTLQVGVPADAGYVITIADQCNYVSDTLVFTLIPHPAPFRVDLNTDTTLCLNDSLELWARVSGGSGYYSIEWPGYEVTDPKMTVSPPSNESYTVNIVDQCGEVISEAVNVGVEQPVIGIVATNAGQDDWIFEAATLPTFCRSYRWDLGDGTLSRLQRIAHSYLDLEDHWVHLKVVTVNGCPAVDSLLVQPPAHIYFPNAFTPDGDGINDTFGPVSKLIDDLQMTIFDRWGQVVFQTDAIDKPWDGKVNGSGAAMTGVYVYKFTASGHLFPTVEDYGHVTLLRGTQGE